MPDPTYTIRRLSRSISLETDELLGIPVSCNVSYRITASEPVEENDAATALRSYLSTNDLLVYLGMPLKSLSCPERWRPFEYLVEARYERNTSSSESEEGGGSEEDPPASSKRPGERTTSSYSTATATRMISLGRIHTYGNMWSSPLLDLQYDSDGSLKAQGVPILVSNGSYQVTHYYKASELSETVRDKIIRCRCTVNDRTWRGWAAGQVLFTGESKTKDPSSGYQEMVFNFQISLNATGISVGSFSVDKDGWDVVTVRAVPQITLVNGVYAKTVAVAGVGVDRVYSRTNFSDLLPLSS